MDTQQIYAKEIESERHQAAIYIETYYERLVAYEGYKTAVLDCMRDLPREARVLDVGCGAGWFLALLHRQGWRNLSGLDISPDMLGIARGLAPSARFFQTPVEEFASSGGQFDVVTCLGTLHHMPDLARVVSSLRELLTPGGLLIVHEPNEDWYYEHHALLRALTRIAYTPVRLKNWARVRDLRRLWAEVPPSPHHEDIAIDELLRTLRAGGFEVEDARFGDTLTRAFEGMLFRASPVDQAIYRSVRWLDRACLDAVARQRAGSALLRLRKAA